MRRSGRGLFACFAAFAAIGIAACGGDEFENEPRPAKPIEVSIEVADDEITVSPAEFGAGIANFTIVNLGEITTAVEIDGPTLGESEEVAPGTTTVLKMEMESGDYEATALDLEAEPFAFAVGIERESASDELLVP